MKYKVSYSTEIHKWYQRWANLHPVAFVLTTLLLGYVLTIPLAIFFELLGLTDKDLNRPDLKKYTIADAIVVIVFLAPMFETLLGQVLPIRLCQRIFKQHANTFAILSSTTLFALAHITYSIWYFLLMLPFGLTLALTYTIFQKRKPSAFWITTLLHATKNLIAILLNYKEFIQ
jgi:membrane protease YdiL (CAAX protease family)